MIKITYPSDLEKLKNKYLDIFGDNLKKMKRRWKKVRLHDIEIEDLLVGDFNSLVDKYIQYKSENISERNTRIYNKIFDYEYYHDRIAKFFMDKENGFNLHTCHYCNTAYINAYGIGTTYSTHLEFANRASIAEWRAIFKESTLPDDKIKQIIDCRPFQTLEDFNRGKFLPKKIEMYKGMRLDDNANHFDLDHLLPKSVCPIIGLSLFNFVPSCQVCNEKLKKDKELGRNQDEWKKISPTYSGSSMADDVVIKLKSRETCSTFFGLNEKSDNYYLDFDTNGEDVYERYLEIFRLKDRYNYHKAFALRILDLKQRYTEEKCDQISRMLSAGLPDNEEKRYYSKEQITEDIFQEKFGEDRCFSKLRKDMLEHN